MAERNSIFQKMTEYNRKLHEKESLIAALRSTNLDSMKGAVKVTSSSFCCNEEVGVRDLSNIAAFDVLVNRNLPIRSSNEQLDGFIFCLLEVLYIVKIFYNKYDTCSIYQNIVQRTVTRLLAFFTCGRLSNCFVDMLSTQ